MEHDSDAIVTTPEYKLFVGGHWLAGREWYEVCDKVTGDVLAAVPMCEDELFEMAVLAARDSAQALAGLSPERRAMGLRRWADSLVRARETLARTLHQETAVPRNWAALEVQQAAAVLRRAAAECERVDAETVAQAPQAQAALASVDISMRHPLGTVAALLPERHPLFYAAQLVGAAFAAGCPVIAVPGPLAPLTAKQFVEQGAQLSWPPGSLNLIFGKGGELGAKLAADPRIGLLVVAGGSTALEELRGARGGRPLLSVGAGAACALLDRSADIPQTTTRLLALRFRSPEIGRSVPLFVVAPQSLLSALNEGLAAGLQALKGGNLADPSAEVAWQVSEGAARRIEAWLGAVQQAGGILVSGGKRQGTYFEPTLVTAPAGYKPLAAPSPETPVLVVDAYDKQPERHLGRFANLDEAYVFAGELQSAFALARITDVPRVDVYTTRAGKPALVNPAPDSERVRQVIAGMTRRKWVGVHFSG